MRLVIEDGKIEFAGVPLIEHINFEVGENSKIAIIGKNGSGKTSLLKVITGELDLAFDVNSTGYINKSNDFNIGYLKQITFSNENNTLEAEILTCYQKIIDLENRLNELAKMLENNSTDSLIKEYSKIHDLFQNNEGYYYQKEYHTILNKFGFTRDDFAKPIKEFSGGEKTKIAFIKLLLIKPELLILDEPTNHLDIDAIEWLEEYLKNYKKSFIVVSHDREFINKVTKIIYEIEYHTITKYTGNYDDYLKEKEVRYRSLEKRYNEQQKEIKHQQELIERFRYKATKAKMVQSRIKQLDKMEIIEPPKKTDNRAFKMNINPYSESGKEVVSIKDLSIGYNKVLAIINMVINKGDKVAVIGGNGSGKSTFLKTITGEIKPLSGECNYGFNVKKGYFDQLSANIRSEKSVLSEYQDTFPHLTNQEARSDLGSFLFTKNDVDKQISVLSGGEVVRLALCKLFKTRPNFLILDEPTNHMDIYSKDRIEDMLQSYKGTLLFVSHDRYFVRKVASAILAIENNVATYYPFGYQQYLAKRGSNLPIDPIVRVSKEKVTSECKTNYKKEIAKLEKSIKECEDEINRINIEFEKEEIYTDFLLTRELEEQLEEKEDELAILMNKWEQLVELLEDK